MLWRVGEQGGDRVLACLMLLVSAGLAVSMSLGSSFESAAARDQQAGLGLFAALFLWFRYAFGGTRAWMLAIDAKRAQLPGLPGRIRRIEALRAAVFALLPALPFAVAGALAAASSIVAITLAGLSFGVLFGVTPYRFSLLLVGGALALLIGTQSGLLAWSLPIALLSATVFATSSALFLRWRIAAMAAAPADAAVGGAYSLTEAIGRHPGSIWTAPDTSPLQAMVEARRSGPRPSSPMALIGGPVAGRLASPGRDLRDWALALGCFPVLITGTYVSFAALDGAAMPALQRVSGSIWPAVVLMWVPCAAVAFLWLGTFRSVREHLRPGHPVRDALHVLPGMPADPSAWRRRLQPLVRAPIAVGMVLVLSTIPLMPEGAIRVVPLFAAALVLTLVALQPRIAVSAEPSAAFWGYVVAALSGALLWALVLLTGISAPLAVS
ncbi:MAG: hypothetical protein ACK5XH_05510 [Lysobacteraceae bacterium]